MISAVQIAALEKLELSRRDGLRAFFFTRKVQQRAQVRHQCLMGAGAETHGVNSHSARVAFQKFLPQHYIKFQVSSLPSAQLLSIQGP